MGILTRSTIIFIIVISVIIRVVLSFLPSFEIDESAYRYFSSKLVSARLDKFYTSENFNSNSIGFLYPLWIIGLIKESFFPSLDFFSRNYDLLLKIPALITDTLSSVVIYYLIRKKWGERWGVLGFLLYMFNPAIVFNTSVWGQYDSISTFFLLLSLLSIINRKAILMSLFFAIALSLKPQAIFFSPIAIILTLKNTKPSTWLLSFFVFLLSNLVIYIPFFPKNPILGIYLVNSKLAGTYICTSCFAFNFWGIFGNWRDDLHLFLSISKVYWGMILPIIYLAVLFLIKPIRIKFQFPYIFLTTALCVMAFYTLLTRMHERYLFAFFPFLLLGALLLKSKILTFFYILTSTLHFLNLYFVYSYFNVIYAHSQSIFFNSFLYQFLDTNFNYLSILSTLFFFCITFISVKFVYDKNR